MAGKRAKSTTTSAKGTSMKGIPSGKMPKYGTGAGSSPTNVVPGSTTSSTQKPFPGPTKPGQPIAMQKALRRKSPRPGGTAG